MRKSRSVELRTPKKQVVDFISWEGSPSHIVLTLRAESLRACVIKLKQEKLHFL